MKNESRKPQLGDVIGIDLGYYQHFGIYVENNQVIHYHPEEEKERYTILEVSFERFLQQEEEFYICDFTKFIDMAQQEAEDVALHKSLKNLLDPKLNLTEHFERLTGLYIGFSTGKYKIYSVEETIKRAYSRLGEISDNWFLGQCEHYAFWCKTGISQEETLNLLIKGIKEQWLRT